MEQTTDPTTTIPPVGSAPQAPSGATAPVATIAPAARPRFRLRRSRTERILGGVCGGLAESLGVDPALLRIGLITLTVLGMGAGVVLYAAVWLLAPETDAP